MGHEHSHSHNHSIGFNKIKRAFVVAIFLNLTFVIIEVVAGLYINSLSVLADAGHNLADVAALALSLLGFRLSTASPTKTFTYGFGKISIIVASLNSLVLLISVGIIGYEAILRLINPPEIPGISIAIIAGVGIVINFYTAFLFRSDKENDVNIKSSYLHLIADALVSVAVLIGGILIYFLQWYWIDSLLSLIVAVVILLISWRLLKESFIQLADGVPLNVKLKEVQDVALNTAGVIKIKHVHVWALSTSKNALTAHVTIKESATLEEEQKIKKNLRHSFEELNIHHATLEIDRVTNA